jgi:hypothetical protein
MVFFARDFNIARCGQDHGMSEDQTSGKMNEAVAERILSPAAQRALAEAEQRRKASRQAAMPTEIGGRGGADPARFGDWEIDGRAIDF